MRLDQPYKVIGDIDAALLDDFAGAIDATDYDADRRRSQMMNLQHTDSILLRHSDAYLNRKPLSDSSQDAALQDFPLAGKYRRFIRTVLDTLALYYSFSDYVALIAKLPTGKSIGRHCDGGPFLESCHRVHIPLVTNPLCLYEVDGVTWHMERGKIYEIDNTRWHSCKNEGPDRAHLIVNLYPTPV